MRNQKLVCLLASLTLLGWSNSTLAQIALEPDETDMPPPIVLEQKGYSAEEYARALSLNQRLVAPINPDLPVQASESSGSSEAVELTAQAHQAMMDAALAAGSVTGVSTQTMKSHIQGDTDGFVDKAPYARSNGAAPRVAPDWKSATPTLPGETQINPNAPGDQQKNFATIANSGWIPPDTQLGVGGGFVLAATNSHYAIYDLNGVVQGAALNPLGTFFAPVTPAGFTGIVFDPKVVYNPWNGRWVMLALAVDFTNQTSHYFMAFSQTSDPRGSWWLYANNNNDFATDAWLDYSGLAVDQYGVYTTGNMFLWTNGFKFSMMRHHDNDGFSGGTLHWWTRWDLRWPDSSRAFTLQPATAHSTNGANGGTTYFVNTRSGSGNEALLWKLSGHTGPDAPGGTVTNTVIPVDQYFGLGSGVVQPGSATNIDGGDARVLNAVYSQNNLYGTLTNDLNDNGDRAAAYTFRLGTDSNTREWSDNLQSPGWYYTYPAVTIKGFGGDTTPVGVYMSITRDDTVGTADVFPSSGVKLYEQPETDGSGLFSIYRSGQAAYVNLDSSNRNRWGDYSGAAYDWSCPGRMWGGTEFAGTGNTWGTQAAAHMMDFSSTSCTGAVPDQVETVGPNGDISDTTPSFVWRNPAGVTVTNYRLIVTKAGATQYDLTVTSAQASCAGNISTCSFTPGTALTLGAHSFTVQASNTVGAGIVSDARSFNIISPPPPNDSFTTAIGIGAGGATGTLVGATLDGSTTGAGATQPDVWYRYTPPGAGTLSVNTCGSQAINGLDSVLSVHADTGVAGTAANEISLNDDWQTGDTSAACPGIRDSALATALGNGDSVLIRVSRFNASTDGMFNLNLSFVPAPPPNDGFNGAITVAGVDSAVGSLYGATRDGSSTADPAGALTEGDVWYAYTPPVDGVLRVNTCGSLDLSNINTVLSVHLDQGVPGTVANEIAANDDWDVAGDPSANCSANLDSAIVVDVFAGSALLIRVTRGDDIGDLEFNLNVSFEPSLDTDGDGVADSADNCTLVQNANQRDTNGDGFGNICDPDLDNNNVVNVSDLGLFRSVFFSNNADADFDGNGVVNVADLGLLRAYFFSPPGPSGLNP